MKKLLIRLNEEKEKIVFNIFFAAITILVVILFYRNIFLSAILLIIIAIIGLYFWKSKATLGAFILGLIFGPLSEITMISFGVWNYTNPNFIGIPIWLFIIWGNAAAFIYQSSIIIKKIFKLKK